MSTAARLSARCARRFGIPPNDQMGGSTKARSNVRPVAQIRNQPKPNITKTPGDRSATKNAGWRFPSLRPETRAHYVRTVPKLSPEVDDPS